MQYEKVKDKLGTWGSYLKPFVETKEFDNIFIKMKQDSQRGRKIAPSHEDVFQCFTECDKDKLRAILIGICPYHTFEDDVPIADGLCLSCSKPISRKRGLQPSLSLFYKALEDEYGLKWNKDLDDYGDMKFYSSQGILCYNISLTVQDGKPNCYENEWAPFTKFFLQDVISQYFSGIPIVLMGDTTHKYEKYIDPLKHYIFKVEHPVGAARNERPWNPDNVFRKIDKILRDNNRYRIMWINDLPF